MIDWARLEARASLRALGSRGSLTVWLAALLLASLFAWLERRAASGFALDRALLGTTFGFIAPLLCLAITRALLPQRLAENFAAGAQYGVDRRWLLCGRAAVLLACQAALCTLLAWFTLIAAGPTSSWLSEWASLTWVAPLAGIAYGALQLFGASLARHGAVYAVVLDWIFGGSTRALGIPFPRSHVANLLGGEPLLGWSQTSSALALWVLASIYVGIALLRIER